MKTLIQALFVAKFVRVGIRIVTLACAKYPREVTPIPREVDKVLLALDFTLLIWISWCLFGSGGAR